MLQICSYPNSSWYWESTDNHTWGKSTFDCFFSTNYLNAVLEQLRNVLLNKIQIRKERCNTYLRKISASLWKFLIKKMKSWKLEMSASTVSFIRFTIRVKVKFLGVRSKYNRVLQNRHGLGQNVWTLMHFIEKGGEKWGHMEMRNWCKCLKWM